MGSKAKQDKLDKGAFGSKHLTVQKARIKLTKAEVNALPADTIEAKHGHRDLYKTIDVAVSVVRPSRGRSKNRRIKLHARKRRPITIDTKHIHSAIQTPATKPGLLSKIRTAFQRKSS
jgi:ribosome-associated translation inhibitor RaiA